jgi:hypothetical protein
MRDASREAALERLQPLSITIGELGPAADYRLRIERTYDNLEVLQMSRKEIRCVYCQYAL